MAFAEVAWEISTSSPSRFTEIAAELARTLESFSPAPLLAHAALVDIDAHDVDELRRGLDALCDRYAGELYYTTSELADDAPVLQGAYPPWADLAAAHEVTGSERNPLGRFIAPRSAPLAAVAPRRRRVRARTGKARRRRGPRRRREP